MKSINIFSFLLVLVASATVAYSATPLSDAELLEITGGGCGAEMCGASTVCNNGESTESGCRGSCSCTSYYGPCQGAQQVTLKGDGGREYGTGVDCPKRSVTSYTNYCAATYQGCTGYCVVKDNTETGCGNYLPTKGC